MKTPSIRMFAAVFAIGLGAVGCSTSAGQESVTAGPEGDEAATTAGQGTSVLPEAMLDEAPLDVERVARDLSSDGRVYLSEQESEFVRAVDLVRMQSRRPSRWTPYDDLNPAIAIVEAIPVYSTESEDEVVAYFDGQNEYPAQDFQAKRRDAEQRLADDPRTPEAMRNDN